MQIHLQTSPSMLKNYFLLAWRHLLKNRGYSAINIAGLSIGMAIALLIGLWIGDELSFDHYAPNHSRIAVGMFNASAKSENFTGDVMMQPFGKALSTQYKDLFTRVAATEYNRPTHLFNFGDKKVSSVGLTAQAELPGMFGFRMLNGRYDATKDPSTIIIDQSLATALFGTSDPIGKTIKLDNAIDYRIGGTYADLPKNTTFYGVHAILPWENNVNSYYNTNTNWDDHNGHLYVELAPGITAEQATARIKNIIPNHANDFHVDAFVYPLDKAYLYNEFKDLKVDGGRIRFVWLFGTIGAFVLLLACINFMNLSTARSEKRAREVGIRKTIGSLRTQLITQFLSESILLALISLIISVILVITALPFFNELSAKNMSIPWTSLWFWLGIVSFALFTGILAGSYPAFYLSGFRPIKVLKGTFKAGKAASLPRQTLVVLQFTVSLTLIIGTIIVFRQINYTKDRPVGYSREGLLTVNINTPDLQNHYEALRTDLIRQGLAANVGASNMTLTTFDHGNSLDWSGKRPDQNTIGFNNVNINSDYGETIGWNITRGRNMSRDFATDSNACILNEAAVKVIGFKDPIGQVVRLFNKPYTVVGVSADMVNNSPYDSAQASIFVGGGYVTEIIVRIKPGVNPHAALARMEPIFKQYNPTSPFLYKFVDEAYAAKFEAEERIGNLAAVFTGLAIFISCLGLFGLAAFVAEQRTKEIGVRKVLGASLLGLWALLSKDFLKLTVLSIVISIPIAWFAMHKWLEGYVYHAPLSWWIFAAAGAGIIGVTLLTVSYQSIKAALMNPVKSLRSE